MKQTKIYTLQEARSFKLKKNAEKICLDWIKLKNTSQILQNSSLGIAHPWFFTTFTFLYLIPYEFRISIFVSFQKGSLDYSPFVAKMSSQCAKM